MKKNGTAMIAVLFLICVISLTGLSLYFANRSSKMVSTNIELIKSKAISEAGINYAYSVLSTSFDNRTNESLFGVSNYANGFFNVQVKSDDEKATIYSEGFYFDAKSLSVVDVQNKDYYINDNDPRSAWSYSIFVNGKMTINGYGNIFGNVFCNNYITQNGTMEWGNLETNCNVRCVSDFLVNGIANVYGSVEAPIITVKALDNIQNKITNEVGLIQFPYLDLTPYYNTALNNGSLFNGQTYSGEKDFGDINGGVLWFNGDVTFIKGCSFNGCIIATGDIRFNGSLTANKIGKIPCIISRDGNITINGSHNVKGLIYCGNTFKLNGSGYIKGTVLVGGDMDINGSYGIMSYDYSRPSSVSNSTGKDSYLSINAWQE